MDITRSVSFIEQQGTPLEKARIATILRGEAPEPDVIQPFIDLQNDDGGFPYRMRAGYFSTINHTHGALVRLDDLGMLHSPTAAKATQYLLVAQKEDGGWDEDPAIAQYDPPPWATPGDPCARVYLSANSAYWLFCTGYSTHPATQKALDFLLAHRDETGKFYGFLHSTWIATSVFALAGPHYAEVVREGLQVLDNRSLAEWADSQISWALVYLGKARLSKDHPFVDKCLAELLRRQGPDGSWASEDGVAFATGATIEVLKVLKHYGLL